jgi:hypothetical protein
MWEANGDNYMYLTHFVHLVGIKEVFDCKW